MQAGKPSQAEKKRKKGFWNDRDRLIGVNGPCALNSRALQVKTSKLRVGLSFTAKLMLLAIKIRPSNEEAVNYENEISF